MSNSRVTISAKKFYNAPDQKTKLNWFTYEIALSFQSELHDPSLVAVCKRHKITEQQIATFCIHYAKHMKKVILSFLRGEIPLIEIPYEPVYAMWPSLSEDELIAIQDHLDKAWDTQLDSCVNCPSRCISEKERLCAMFDDPDYNNGPD